MSRKEKTITLATFRSMKNIFNENIKPELADNYSDSTWQDFNDLKEYFNFIEDKATEKGIEISGIRFHFIAEEDENKQLTIALVPTYKDGDIHIDFDPVFSTDGSPKKLSDIQEGSELCEELGSIMDRNDPYPSGGGN